MSYPVYFVPAGDVLPVFFSTYAGSTGASITMTGLAVTDIEIYKDGSVTQRASDAGYTLLDTDGTDVDGLTGIHGFSIDTGDNTDPGFYTVGAWFHVVVSSVTVDSQTVNFIACAFRLLPAESVAGVPKVDPNTWDGTDITTGVPLAPTVAGRTLDVSAGGEAGIDWANIGSPTTAQNLSATNIDVDQVVASVSGAVGSVTGAVGSIAAGGITAGSFAAGAIDAAAIAANAIGASELASDAVAEIADAVWDEDATAHQTGGTFGQAIGDPGADANTIFKAVVTDATGATVGVDTAAILADTGTDGVIVATNNDKTGYALGVGGIGATAFAAGALDAAAIAANAIGASELAADAVAEIADAVWDEATSGHTTAGSYGDKLGAHIAGVLKAIIGSGSTTTAVVLDATTGIDGGAPSATDDFYNDRVLVYTSGALAGQAVAITDYTGATGTLTTTASTAAPAAGVTGVIV
jgi:hypothetical protein